MSVSLSNAVDEFLSRKTQDSGRLYPLAQYCIDAFAALGLAGVRGGKADEVGIRGLGRQKDWDLAFVLADKPRLLVSLKSILKNLSGVVPNRLDDLMGEVANVQQLSPELVIGYVVVLDERENSQQRDRPGTWIDHFEENLRRIAIRRAPLWNQGLIEAVWLIRIDTRMPPGQRIVDPSATHTAGSTFFRALLDELYLREPALTKASTPSLVQTPDASVTGPSPASPLRAADAPLALPAPAAPKPKSGPRPRGD